MHNLYQADFRHNFFSLETPQNIYLSWRKKRTESHFSKPFFDMQGPDCCKSYNVYVDPQNFFFIGTEKFIQPLSSLHQIANFSPGRDMMRYDFSIVRTVGVELKDRFRTQDVWQYTYTQLQMGEKEGMERGGIILDTYKITSIWESNQQCRQAGPNNFHTIQF